jgi:hypothetical protein
MRLALTYTLTLGGGFLIALGIGWLVGLWWPSALLPVTLIISAWWAWTGWKYARFRDRLNSARNQPNSPEGINEYILNRPIADLPENSVSEFGDADYDILAREHGIVCNFRGEVFYRAENNQFIGRECIHTLIATLDGKIYKVLFGFISPSTKEDDAFREDAYDYLFHKFGDPSQIRKLSEFHKISIWDTGFGNVILDAGVGTSVIFTSAHVRNRNLQ